MNQQLFCYVLGNAIAFLLSNLIVPIYCHFYLEYNFTNEIHSLIIWIAIFVLMFQPFLLLIEPTTIKHILFERYVLIKLSYIVFIFGFILFWLFGIIYELIYGYYKKGKFIRQPYLPHNEELEKNKFLVAGMCLSEGIFLIATITGIILSFILFISLINLIKSCCKEIKNGSTPITSVKGSYRRPIKSNEYDV